MTPHARAMAARMASTTAAHGVPVDLPPGALPEPPPPPTNLLAGPPADPGVTVIDDDSIVLPAGSEDVSSLFITCVKQDESFGLCNAATSESRSLCER